MEKIWRKYETIQNSLEVMSAEAVEYIRGVPVVKTFGRAVFSFKRFKEAIDEYEKWTLGFTKNEKTNGWIYNSGQFHFVVSSLQPMYLADMRSQQHLG